MAASPPAPASPRLTRRAVLAQAWPIIVGQALVPLVGIVDVAVIGRMGDAGALAGVALGTTIVNLLFWTFGFLRMGVTGLTAQAHGAADADEVALILPRALLLGGAIGAALLALGPLIAPGAVTLIAAPAAAAAPARAFVAARLLGAPGALGSYAINGWLLGLGRTRRALAVQLAMNGVNIALDLLFVGAFGLGARGVGLGTAAAEWSALGVGLIACRGVPGGGWRARLAGIGRARLIAPAALGRLIAVNVDIMARTLALLLLFAWFAHAGARLGAVPLAANHVLMQFVAVSAFVLDGFAFTAEARVGAAIGAGSPAALRRAVRLTGEFTLAGGALFAGAIALTGGPAVRLLTHDPAVRAAAAAMLPWCALVPLLGAPSWLLDGVFIGATRGRILRNAALLATAAYLLTDRLLRPWGATGVWLALLASYAYRALSLGVCMPLLMRRLGARSDGHAT